MTTPEPERPDLTAWRRRQALGESNAAQPVPSGKTYQRKAKHPKEQDRDE
ncbi:hypothetical protein [Nocardia flavorosea]|uniref:Uncharacterized protein n=1 Tax=Nocardia flavorosea TaxID=53429 RepID=A0A846YSA2_9NOCA|nr:hypothetical protein [Nocardia flavorosea]NKY60430.1 hypothetical protein [Nocardia flavorosea]